MAALAANSSLGERTNAGIRALTTGRKQFNPTATTAAHANTPSVEPPEATTAAIATDPSGSDHREDAEQRAVPEPEAEGGDHRHAHGGDDRPHDPVGRHVRRSAPIEQERRHDDELGQVDGAGPGEGELRVADVRSGEYCDHRPPAAGAARSS